MSARASYQFVDTNLLVYAHDRAAGKKHTQALGLVRELWESGRGSLSIQVLQEFYVVVTRKVPQPLASETAAQVIADLRAWRVHRPGVDDVLGAISLQVRHQLTFWDAMLLQSASQLGCEVLWSEDLHSGQEYQGVRVVNPFAART